MYRPIHTAGLVALGVLAGLPATAREPNRDERKALAYVGKLEGKVEIDRDSPDKPVVGVDLVGCKVPDDALDRLRVFAKLQRLSLGQTTLSDAGLAPVKAFARLEKLELSGTSITDKGLAHLEGLPQLRTLD